MKVSPKYALGDRVRAVVTHVVPRVSITRTMEMVTINHLHDFLGDCPRRKAEWIYGAVSDDGVSVGPLTEEMLADPEGTAYAPLGTTMFSV